jgi:HD-like signal output (HDOD) protein
MLDYLKLVRAAESLDPVPASVSRLVSLIAGDRWAFADVERVIAQDQALTGRVLQIANSAWSGSLTRIGTVRDAIIRIGVGPIVSMAVGTCIAPVFRRALPEYGLSEGELWRHSLAASLAAETLAVMSPSDVPAESVTAALLHDVGKLVLARFLTPDLLEGLARVRAEGERPALQAEVDVLGVHHGQLGGLIARHWCLPDRLAEAISHHHAPDRVGDMVCDVVSLANSAAKVVIGRPEADPAEHTPCPNACARLGLAPGMFDRLCGHVASTLDHTLAWYNNGAAGPLPPAPSGVISSTNAAGTPGRLNAPLARP